MKHKSFSSITESLNLTIIFTFFLFSKIISGADPRYESCKPKYCGNQSISFPFNIKGKQESYCGFPGFDFTCQNDFPILHTRENDYSVRKIFYGNQSLRLSNAAVLNPYGGCSPPIRNSSIDEEKFEINSGVSYLHLLSNCSSLPDELSSYRINVGCGANGSGFDVAVFGEEDGKLRLGLERCETDTVAPVELRGGDRVGDYVDLLRRGFLVKWKALNCSICEGSGGRCGFDYNTSRFQCFCPDRPHSVRCRTERSNLKVILGTAIPGGVIILMVCLLILAISFGNKWNKISSYIFTRRNYSDPSSNSDIEGGSIYFGVPVFSYTELEEATNNFDPSKELGDGGYGTVYHGKLQDGREVAVKRLYEHNYKRVAQFMNEIEILTRLRHRNLVSLYGCTSRQSRELLLVYEYIPNGTVADHLHGDRASDCPLSWPIRMNIALETANALAYLHASDIIHRDVKTNNILLDSNFCVKVADFGLSRLFPTDVTHVSTAPQGTPGYVDPEYHQCYQLTDKSDVYSFGVVLVELVSSMPAVDIGRHRHEINLANLAMHKIQNQAFNELIDPSLGFESDPSVERMTTSVAEVAFRCLQLEKEMRPTMDEVLEALKEIQEYRDEDGTGTITEDVGVLISTPRSPPSPSPEGDEAVLLKNRMAPRSPDSVADKWVSCSTTSISSG